MDELNAHCWNNVPNNHQNRAVTVVGCGILGRRIACVWASGGYEVYIYDHNRNQLEQGLVYIHENLTSFPLGDRGQQGKVHIMDSLPDRIHNSWLVIEAVPEDLALKTQVFATLERLAASDAILATNSSSFKSSSMLNGLRDRKTATRILNAHYHMPPERMLVELMTSGHTAEKVLSFMVLRHKEVEAQPYIVRQESTGFIMNRIWASVKREVLQILAEGVATPQDIDELWRSVIESTRCGPCRLMDMAGLDTVAAIEANYCHERGLSMEKTVNFLEDNYLSQGRLGSKSDLGGLLPHLEYSLSPNLLVRDPGVRRQRSLIIALDTGLGRKTRVDEGEIVAFSTDGDLVRTIANNQFIPDGVDVDTNTGRLFWSCMGVPGRMDGAVYSANYDGTNIQIVLSPGRVNTPKQLRVEPLSKKLYFADREGQGVYRCGFDGSRLEQLVDNRVLHKADHATREDATKWCVGITISRRLGKVFWSQKGPPKGGLGRIFSANISMSPGETATSRTDIVCILDKLPEPTDLDIDEDRLMLYWTDRGELPWGNSVNCVQLDGSGMAVLTSSPTKYTVLSRNLNEAIGLKLDVEANLMYFSDSGGSIYRSQLDGGERIRLVTSERNFTGMTLL